MPVWGTVLLQGRLQLLLSSEQFIAGLVRIMKHENDSLPGQRGEGHPASARPSVKG